MVCVDFVVVRNQCPTWLILFLCYYLKPPYNVCVCKLVQVQTLHEVLIPMSSTTAQWTRCGHQQTGDRVPPLTNLDILETEGSLVRGAHCLV